MNRSARLHGKGDFRVAYNMSWNYHIIDPWLETASETEQTGLMLKGDVRFDGGPSTPSTDTWKSNISTIARVFPGPIRRARNNTVTYQACFKRRQITEDVPLPEIGPEDVLVLMAFVGVCRSDVHFFDDGYIDRFFVREPLTIGHELSGVISRVGANIRDLKPGDRVAIDTNRPCLQCKNCQDRRFNICTNGKFAGLPPVDGGCARFMGTPAYTCHKLPENVSLQAGACMEPLSVALHGLHRGKITAGEVVVVIGAGPIGLLAMQSAKALGARKVLIVDINQQRLELAKSLGADATFNSSGHTDPEKTAKAIKEVLEDEADLGVECTGAPGTLNTAIYACRIGGRVVVLGIGKNVMEIHIGAAALREIDLIGALCNNNFPEAVELVATGKVDVLPLISHVLPLGNITDAIDLVRDGRSSTKVMIDCQK